MPRPVPLPPPGFDELSADEKIDYLQSLWDRIAATPEAIPVPPWHREILDERLKDLEAHPNRGDNWDVVQAGDTASGHLTYSRLTAVWG